MKKILTVKKWIFFQKSDESRNGFIPCGETNTTAGLEISKVEKETERAVFVWVIDSELDIEKIWLPKSQIVKLEEYDETTKESKEVKLKADSQHERTTEEVDFDDPYTAQDFIDEMKKVGRFSSCKVLDGGKVKVFIRKAA